MVPLSATTADKTACTLMERERGSGHGLPTVFRNLAVYHDPSTIHSSVTKHHMFLFYINICLYRVQGATTPSRSMRSPEEDV